MQKKLHKIYNNTKKKLAPSVALKEQNKFSCARVANRRVECSHAMLYPYGRPLRPRGCRRHSDFPPRLHHPLSQPLPWPPCLGWWICAPQPIIVTGQPVPPEPPDIRCHEPESKTILITGLLVCIGRQALREPPDNGYPPDVRYLPARCL